MAERTHNGSFYRRHGKRWLDLTLALLLLAVLAAPLLVIGAAVLVSSGRPVLFRQRRPGLGGEPFTLYKFRTMREPEAGAAHSDAARITTVGRLLRRTSLDELPELWNVVRGDLSLVGPRPLLVRYLDRYSPRQRRRHEVRPGITGWAQIHGRNELEWEERLERDVWYVENLSLGLDLRILARTVGAVLRGQGISAPGHATMPEFRGDGR